MPNLSTLEIPETILPSQFYRQPQCSKTTGERLLLLALIQTAQEDMRGTNKAKDYGKIDARKQNVLDWMDGVESPYPFKDVCDYLGVSTREIRKKIMKFENRPGRSLRASHASGRHKIGGIRHYYNSQVSNDKREKKNV